VTDNVTPNREFKTWMCLICGWIYDEAAGIPEEGIPPGTRWEYTGAFDGTPIFMGGSTVDAFVPVARMRESAAIFRAMGAQVTEQFYDQDGHVVTDAEIAAARAIIQLTASAAEA